MNTNKDDKLSPTTTTEEVESHKKKVPIELSNLSEEQWTTMELPILVGEGRAFEDEPRITYENIAATSVEHGVIQLQLVMPMKVYDLLNAANDLQLIETGYQRLLDFLQAELLKTVWQLVQQSFEGKVLRAVLNELLTLQQAVLLPEQYRQEKKNENHAKNL